jgi:hypothetical protein
MYFIWGSKPFILSCKSILCWERNFNCCDPNNDDEYCHEDNDVCITIPDLACEDYDDKDKNYNNGEVKALQESYNYM